MKKILLPLTLLLALSCNPRQTTTNLGEGNTLPSEGAMVQFTPPKNIILMIGDGMGLTQITAGMYLNGNKLNLEHFKYIGLHKSYASDDLVTDSAAGATALSIGQKTYNGAIGVDKKGKPVRTILEECEERGLATGLVVTSSITHATPASFYAHQKNREMVEEIAADMLKVDVDFWLGGGKKHFDRRKDEQDLVAKLKQKGYAIHSYLDNEIADLAGKLDTNQNFGYFTADTEPLPVAQGRDYLLPGCLASLDYLSKKSQGEGFFLMVEGSQIDWGGHANDSKYITTEMIDFDNAIGAVLDFARKNGETLVIVTADHETGGYAINPTSTMDSIVAAFTTQKHTAALIPVFAWGPGQELFSGIYENTAIYDKMRLAFGFSKKDN